MIYFDNSATSFYKPDIVKKTITNAINNYTANPGRSGHILSQRVAEKVYEVREKIKEFFKADGYNVIFTKNCTEALNLAILGSLKTGDHVITTCYEHNSVLRPLEKLKAKGVEVTIIRGEMREMADKIKNEIRENTRLVITTHVSNVTGDMCDIDSVGRICKDRGVLYLVDGAQSSGHIKIDLNKSNVDMFSFAGHKGLLGIAGVGGLIVRDSARLDPILFGGTGTDSANLIQPVDTIEGFESGTLPTIAILSIGAGVEYLSKNFENIIKKEEKLSKYLYFSLKNLDFLKIYSKVTTSNIVTFNVDGYDSATIANLLNDESICVRSGLHCAPLVHEYLGTLDSGAVRVSIDFNNSVEEIDRLVRVLKKIKYQT